MEKLREMSLLGLTTEQWILYSFAALLTLWLSVSIVRQTINIANKLQIQWFSIKDMVCATMFVVGFGTAGSGIDSLMVRREPSSTPSIMSSDELKQIMYNKTTDASVVKNVLD